MNKIHYLRYLPMILLSWCLLMVGQGIAHSTEGLSPILGKRTSTQVTIWTTPKCNYCHRAKSYLQQRKIAYTEQDVSNRGIAVPVLFVCGQRMEGWNARKFEKLYAKCQ